MNTTVQKAINDVIIDPQISLRGIDDDHVENLAEAQLEYGESEWQDRWHGSLNYHRRRLCCRRASHPQSR